MTKRKPYVCPASEVPGSWNGDWLLVTKDGTGAHRTLDAAYGALNSLPGRIRSATGHHAMQLAGCVSHLRLARDMAVEADCPRTARSIRDALKSAEGALRHMKHRLRRTSDGK